MARMIPAVLAALLTVLALCAPALAGSGHCVNGSVPTESTDPNVKIADCSFQAAVLRVPIGTRVTWTNADPYLPHIVSGIGWGAPQSALMKGDTFSHDFAEAGIYPYTCPLHPGMSAVVFVGDVVAPTTGSGLIAARAGAAPVRAADGGPGGMWLALTVMASILVSVTSFAAGRYFPRT